MDGDGLGEALDAAAKHAAAWLDSVPERRVPASATVDEVLAALTTELPAEPSTPLQVIEELQHACEPGLTAMPSGRFFGFVIGGTHPAALAADWLVSAWDQNAGMRLVTPSTSAVEELAARWVLDLLGLPDDAGVGFVTGATTANFTCLAAARDSVLRARDWDVGARGLAGGPAVRVLAGEEAHMSVDLALRYLGLGQPETVEADEQGRMRPDALRVALAGAPAVPTIVVLQAGNIHSGAFDPFTELVTTAHEAGAWVHVDGAFGLFAAASSTHRHLTSGMSAADSWATDAHKTLNVPYDCGIALVRDALALRAAMGHEPAPYLITDEAGDPYEKVPEMSRRARSIPVWAVLRALGRRGVEDLVDGLVDRARAFAAGLADVPGATVLNDVVFTQVTAAMEDDETTSRTVDAVLRDGAVWISGSRWHDRAVLRASMSNWSTTPADVEAAVDAVRRARASLT